MARIRWHGAEYTATPVRQLPNGTWIMQVHQHGPRFTAGSEIAVKPNEILEMAAAETPDAGDSAKALEAAMAAERKAMPSVESLIAKAKEEKNDAEG